jgi:hypothetical protein
MDFPVKNCPVKASQKTFFEWRTKCSKPIPIEKMEMIRSIKLTMISDLLKDMHAELAVMDVKRTIEDMDVFVAKKIGNVEVPGESKCPFGSGAYTFDQAKKDALRYNVPDVKKGFKKA